MPRNCKCLECIVYWFIRDADTDECGCYIDSYGVVYLVCATHVEDAARELDNSLVSELPY